MAPEPSPASDSANGRRIAVLAAVFVLNSAASTYVACFASSETSELPNYLGIGIVDAQVTLLAVWSAFGAERGLIRLGGSLFLFFLAMTAVALNAQRELGDWTFVVTIAVIMFGHWLFAQMPLWPLRIFGGYRIDRLEVANARNTQSERQFNLGQLLVVTAIVGVLVGLGRLAYSDELLQQTVGETEVLMYQAVIVIGNTSLGLLAAWAALARRWLVAWLVVSAGYSAAAAWLVVLALGKFTSAPPSELEPFKWYFAAHHVWLVGCLLLVRFAGYRIIRRTTRPPHEPEP